MLRKNFFWSFLLIMASISAGSVEITTGPVMYYNFGITSSQSVGEIIANHNAVQQMNLSKCLNQLSSCSLHQVNGYTPSAQAVTYNGVVNSYDVQTTQTSYYKDSQNNWQSTVQSPVALHAILLDMSCPSGFELVTKVLGSPSHRSAYCKKSETKSCLSEGNPIDVGSGNKYEYEIDFQTADGLLKVERYYKNQYVGWDLGVKEVVDIAPGTQSLKTTGYSVVSSRKRYSLNPDNPLETITKTIDDPVAYFNPFQKNHVYIPVGNQSYRFSESNGNYIGDGLIDRKNKLIRISPVGSNGEEWKLVENTNDISYFSSDGKLLRTDFSTGGSLFYTYANNKLVTKSDHLGRSLAYSYDQHSRLISIALPDNQLIIYSYSDDEEAPDYYLLKKVTWPNGESVEYIYNESANIVGVHTLKMLTGKLDALSERIGIYKYNNGKAVSTESALGSRRRVITYSGGTTNVLNGLNIQYTYNFQDSIDGTRLLYLASQPAGSGCAAATRSASYSTDGLKQSETNFNGHKSQFAYEVTRALETVRVEGIDKNTFGNFLTQNAYLPTGARKTTTQWHTQYRKPIKKSEPKLITTLIYNGDADPFNSNQIASCAPVTLPLLCHKVRQATTDPNGAAGLNAALDNTQVPRHEFYTYNARGQQLTFSRAATGTPDETREYYETTTTDWTLGDLKKITNSLGHETEFTRYDPNGRLLEMVDANGIEAEFTYDVRGRLLTQTVAGNTTVHTYDLNGNRISSELPNGVLYTYHYDLAKRLIAVENSLGEKINYEYDVENNLRYERITNTSNTQTYVKQHVYDALSRVQNTLNSNNQGNTYLYDAKGNLTGEVDANTKTTSHTVDPLDRLTRTTDALNSNTDFTYDAQGNLTQVKDARNNSTTYTYNAFGDLVSQTSPDTGTTIFTYDAAGNRTSSTDARGVVVNYGYDALNRLTSVEYPAASSENITYTYDSTSNGNYGVGRLTGIDTAAVQMDFEYNHQGLITKKYTQVANTFSSTEYDYDAAGILTSVIYPSGREVNYELDSLGRISGITTKSNSSAPSQTLIGSVGYLPFGPANTYTYGNGLSHSQTYDLDYRLTGITVGGILNRIYGYDPVNNITSIVNGLNAANDQTFGYDALNRLISAGGGYGTLGYTYDAVGNRLTETRNSVTDSYSYSSTSNKLTSITRTSGNRSFIYDSAGNPTQRTADDNSNQTFTFNNANRLSDVSVNGSPAASYTYNPLGQRVVKTLANSSKEIYHYDETGQLIAVTDGTGATLREYIYLNNQQIALVSNGNLYYIHSDHLNTPQVVTDNNQQVVWMADYEPFGKLAANQTNSIELYSRFPGQYLDEETGLYYNYFRDYDPSIGRYIESDPIGLEGGINTYAYVTGNPLKFFDFLGLNNCYFTTDGSRICKGPDLNPLPNRCPSGDCAVYPPQVPGIPQNPKPMTPKGKCELKCHAIGTPICAGAGAAGGSGAGLFGTLVLGGTCQGIKYGTCKLVCDDDPFEQQCPAK